MNVIDDGRPHNFELSLDPAIIPIQCRAMQIAEFAQLLLHADRIEDKLLRAPPLLDTKPDTRASLPRLPGRPPELDLAGPKKRIPFPKLHRGCSTEARGQVLHFFANHELLAIELMAVFLLRFPDAPPALRRAVVGTIAEEQQHMRLYMERMAQLGVSLGQVPVSSFFWDCLAAMADPLEYLAGMSMTLEQANLDFCTHYLHRFEQLDDEQSAAVMRRIREDEIGHVKLGVTWFNRLSAKDSGGLWERYRRSLIPPLTPARAKGMDFDREARRQAGLTDDFIDNLAVYSHSRGRPPGVYWFNPSSEDYFADPNSKYQPPEALQQIARDLETLPMFLCGKDDVVLVREAPNPSFLLTLQKVGIELPEFRSAGVQDLSGRKLAKLRPWAWSPDSELLLSPLLPWVHTPPPRPPVRAVFSKSFAAGLLSEYLTPREVDWLAPLDTVGQGATDYQQARSLIDSLRGAGHNVVIKAPFGTAGRAMVRELSDIDRKRNEVWIRRKIEEQGEVLIEPWLDGMLNLSVQIEVSEAAEVSILGVTRFNTDRRGQYLGTFLGNILHQLPDDLRRFVIGPGGGQWRLLRQLHEVGKTVGAALAQQGHRGPAGIDALVYRDSSGSYRFKPIIEINPRHTMGQVALRLEGLPAKGQVGFFSVISTAAIIKAGHRGPADYAAGLAPVVRNPGPKGGITSGTLCLNDPARAKRALALLSVGKG